MRLFRKCSMPMRNNPFVACLPPLSFGWLLAGAGGALRRPGV